jgi:peroxiredoxin
LSTVIFGVVFPWLIVGLFVALGSWLGFQLVQQNGRILAHLEMLEQRLGQPGPFAAPGADLSSGLPPPVGAPGVAVPQAVYDALLQRLEALEERLGQLPQAAPAPPMPAGLPVGSPAPEFMLPDLSGGLRALSEFRGRRLLLIFFNPHCGFCTQMAPDLAALPTDGAEGYPVPLVVSTGDADGNRQLVEEHGIRCPVLLQQGMEVAAAYDAHGTPMGYLLDEQGQIASELAVGAVALLALAGAAGLGANGRNGHDPLAARQNGHAALGGRRSLADSKINRNGLSVGTRAPDFRVPRLDGGELALDEYRGRRVLLVFSDPKCGPCDQLAPHLEQFARQTQEVQVMMVSRGDAAANRAKVEEHGLTFPVGLQNQWEISREYAMFGTPIGYLIDGDGAIAADVAVGAEPILALLSDAAVRVNGKTKASRRGKPTAARRR